MLSISYIKFRGDRARSNAKPAKALTQAGFRNNVVDKREPTPVAHGAFTVRARKCFRAYAAGAYNGVLSM